MPKGSESPVAILTNQNDFAADRVVRRLGDLSVPVRRINIEDVTGGSAVGWSPDSEVHWRSVWWRQFVAEPAPGLAPEEIDGYLVQRSQWQSWLPTVQADRWMNPLWEARRAESKIEQLRTAKAVGLAVPSTIVTNSADEARTFASERGPAIVKSLGAAFWQFSDQSFVFTNRLTVEMLQADPADWAAQPLIVQEEVAAAFEVRILWIGGRLVAVEAPRCDDTVDWRTTSGLEWGETDVPSSVDDAFGDYCRSLGLAYCAADFLIAATGEWYFLEGNQCGEWGFVDRAVEVDVAGLIAEWLA